MKPNVATKPFATKPFATKPFILAVRAYQYGISPFLGHRCRFHPRCSEYAVESLQRHGVVKGLGLAARRLGRCHPWHPGGYDPVP